MCNKKRKCFTVSPSVRVSCYVTEQRAALDIHSSGSIVCLSVAYAMTVSVCHILLLW